MWWLPAALRRLQRRVSHQDGVSETRPEADPEQ